MQKDVGISYVDVRKRAERAHHNLKFGSLSFRQFQICFGFDLRLLVSIFQNIRYCCIVFEQPNPSFCAMASSSNKTKSSSSFDAFSKVDDLVSKPVLGSDGAASWQNFRKDHKAHVSSAPKAPLKKADKLGTGFSSWEEERAHETRIRLREGHAATNAGYSNFRIKHNNVEAANRKRKQQVENRIRPDDKEYFIMAKTFEGWKFDYVFTTRNGSTGYYWDGMDSIKKENGELKTTTTSTTTTTTTSEEPKSSNDETLATKKPKKKRKKDKGAKGPTFVHDPNNPMEQMQAILQQRNQKLLADNNSLPSGWEAAKDPSTGNTYYFHRTSGQRSWEKPQASQEIKKEDEKLPEGWKPAVDPASGKTYYHHSSGKTSWTKPE